jgi:predicted ATPase
MRISRVELKNWMNFKDASVDVAERAFLVGPNACGKSNFLDALRFLRDIANRRGGGLQKACEDRGGVSKIRCLAARRDSEVSVAVELSDGEERLWRYEVAFTEAKPRDGGGARLKREVVYKGQKKILHRPNDDDDRDPPLLSQTHLEQINLNREFREIAEFFETINYLHLVPQIIRHQESVADKTGRLHEYGLSFLERVRKTEKSTREVFLKKIARALSVALPQFAGLKFVESSGNPHLVSGYKHWRRGASPQDERQFSDGTLRLIGLLWSLLDGRGPLLLEEPELSLHVGIVRQFADLMHGVRKNDDARQVLVTTHDSELLARGVGAEEILVLRPDPKGEGTKIERATSLKGVAALLEAGMPPGRAIMPHTDPENISQLALFSDLKTYDKSA